jgi:hypothetical protein
MRILHRNTMAAWTIAAIALLGTATAIAKDDAWFVLGEQTLKTEDPSATIKSQGSRWDKDVKQVKLQVEGADVTISKLVLSWDNRKDDTINNVGTLKSGGQTAPFNAPGIKGRLTSATIYYTIGGGKKTATVKVMGYD